MDAKFKIKFVKRFNTLTGEAYEIPLFLTYAVWRGHSNVQNITKKWVTGETLAMSNSTWHFATLEAAQRRFREHAETIYEKQLKDTEVYKKYAEMEHSEIPVYDAGEDTV